MTQAGADDDHVAARAMAEKVAIWVEFDEESRRPVMWFENSGDLPVYKLRVVCDSYMGGAYPVEKPHHGRKVLVGFTRALGRGSEDDDWYRRRAAIAEVGCTFTDAAGRRWGRKADGTLVGGSPGEVARSAFVGMRQPGRAPLITVRCE